MRPRTDANALINLVYASLLGESPWQVFLDELSGILPNGKALLFFHDTSAAAGAFSLNAGMEPSAVDAYGAHYSSLNPWMLGATTRQLGRVVQADSMLPRCDLVRTEFYNDFLRPQQIESGIGVTILREQNCNFMLSLLSAATDGAAYDEAIACMQALVPHLQRAFNWYRRDQGGASCLLSGKGLSESLRAGIITIGAARQVRAVNSVALNLLRDNAALTVDCAGRFQCARTDILDCVDAMLANSMREDCATLPSSFLLPQQDHRSPVRLTVIPPSGDPETDFFRGPECVVLLEEPICDVSSAAKEFGALHGLTIAETRVVTELAAGETLEEIAASGGTSVETVRKQLKHVFAKTGTNRQVEIVRNVCLLAGTMINRPS